MKSLIRKIIKDLFIISLITWLLLVLIEFLQPGAVQRFINLEYWFYLILLLSLLLKFNLRTW